MKYVLLSVFLLTAAGCASKATGTAEPKRTVEEILSSSTALGDYGKPERCLPMSAYNRIEVLDRQHLLFEGRGGKAWLNKLRTECPGLRRGATLRIDVHSGRVCNLDSVTAIETRRLFWDRISATCSLSEFTPIPAEQAEFLKQETRGR